MKRIIFAVLFIFILIAVILGFIFWQNKTMIASISTFDECAAAGYPVMESYPARCMTPDKRSFTQELTAEQKKKLVPTTQQPNIYPQP